MEYRDFVKATIMGMDDSSLEMLKNALIGEYLSFSIIPTDDVNKTELAEKVCDYFEKIELKSRRNFDKHVEEYFKDIDSIVACRIEKTPQPKKGDTTPIIIPRARRYYEKAIAIKNSRNLTPRHLINYSRLMFCLYTEIIRNEYKVINGFNYSAYCLKPESIVASMKNEQDTLAGALKKNHFDIKDLYSNDTCTFIIAIIVLYKIMSEKIQGEYYYE